MTRQALFDLAVNRAASYAARLGLLEPPLDKLGLAQGLELWYLKTRFAYRVPLEQVITALMLYPGPEHHWQGGQTGDWQPGSAPRP